MNKRLLLIACIAILLARPSGVIAAQEPVDSRAEIIAREQALKASQPPSSEPNKAEALVRKAQELLLDSPNGPYPYFGSVWRGGGFTLGAGYRRFYGDNTYWDVKGLYSAKNYQFIEAGTRSLTLADGRLQVGGAVGWRSAPQVAYFGLGIDTSQDQHANYGFEEGWISGDARLQATRWLHVALNAGYERYTLQSGAGDEPSIETIYTPATAPGLGASPDYLHTIATAGVDRRRAAGYARAGGLYEVRFHNYHDTETTYSFNRLDTEVVQHLPILRETWVVSLHGLLETTLDGNVPYFQMPSIGGGSSLRGFSSWRFRDRHSLLTQAEWRWIPNRRGIDMALFYDAGMVAAELGGLTLNNFVSDYGIGVRLHSMLTTPVRVELARSREGFRVVFAASAAF